MSSITEVRTGEWQRLPEGFAPDEPLYVLTDIHGCYEALMRLVVKKPDDARLVFLGDAIDRGPDPLGVLNFLLKDKKNVLLKGNHDAMAWCAYPPNGSTAGDWRNNGGWVTRDAFREAMDGGMPCGVENHGVPKLFEEYWHRTRNWWQSGNVLFVHAGMPPKAGARWLEEDPETAVMDDWSFLWWRPRGAEDVYHEPRLVDGKEVYTVFGHTPMLEEHTLLDYGMSLDKGYGLKMAAEMRPDGRVRLVTTPCDEVK